MEDRSGVHDHDRTSATLLLRLRKGGPDKEVAWSEFFEIYAPIIRGFACRMGASSDVADDIVQDLMRRFFQVSSKFSYSPEKGRFRGYLKTCAYRVLAEYQKSRGKEISLDCDIAQVERGDEFWENEWRRRRLTLALTKVKQQYARRRDSIKTYQAFEQCSLFKQSASEVAGKLGMSIESVHAANSRVMKSLRIAIEESKSLLD